MKKCISYSAISRDNVILAQYTSENGDFDCILNKILSQIEITNPKIQFDQDGHRFYILHNENGINTTIATDSEYPPENCLKYLDQINLFVVNNYKKEWDKANAYTLGNDFKKYIEDLFLKNSIQTKNETENEEIPIIEEIKMDALEQTILSPSESENITEKFYKTARNLKIKQFIKQNWFLFAGLFIVIIIIIVLISL